MAITAIVVSIIGALVGWLAQPVLRAFAVDRVGKLNPKAHRILSVPVITIGTAAVGAMASTSPQSPIIAWTLVTASLVAWWLAAIDAAIHRLPNPLVALLAGIFVSGYSLEVVFGRSHPADLGRALLAGGLIAAGFGVAALIRPRALGLGDVKVSGALGLGIGWFGWETIGLWLLAAFILAGVFAVGLVVTRRAKPQDTIAFGPWLIIGAVLAIASSQ